MDSEPTKTPKIRGTPQICVRVYFNPDTFKEITEQAQKSGKRRVGIKLFKDKPHGFAGQTYANTKGIAQHLKHCAQYWVKHEAERATKAAEILTEEKRLQEEKAKLGFFQ